MIRKQFLIVWRHFKRHKGHALLNVTSLSIGLAIFFLTFLYVRFELSFDRQLADHERVYRVSRGPFAGIAPSFIPLLEADFEEIQSITRLLDISETQIEIGEEQYLEQNVYMVEQAFVDIFDIRLLAGSTAEVFRSSNNALISESVAQKLFKRKDPIGEQMLVYGQLLVQIAGVFPDRPENTHFPFRILLSYEWLKGQNGEGTDDYYHGTTNFNDNVTHAYLKLKDGADPKGIAQRIPAFIDRHLDQRSDKTEGRPPSDYIQLELTNVADIHLHSHKMSELDANGDIRNVWVFSIIGIFMLLIGAVNYINLSTAKASDRTKEVGLKKIMGSSKFGLIKQFLAETTIYVVISTAVALIMVEILLPVLQSNLQISLIGFHILTRENIVAITLILLLIIIIAGFYPAYYLSSFQPSSIIKGKLFQGRGGNPFRRFLIIFQFTISISLIISIAVVVKQMNLIRTSNVGFDRENVLMIPMNTNMLPQWATFKHEAESEPEVLAATISKRSIGGELADDAGYTVEYKGESLTHPFSMPHNRVDFDFFKTYGIKLVAGRTFDRNLAADSTEAFIINQVAAENIGIEDPEDALGLSIQANGRNGFVIGVVNNFNYESLHKPVKAILTYLSQGESNTMAIKLKAGATHAGIKKISKLFERHFPNHMFEFEFLDQRLGQLYMNESRLFKLFQYFSAVALAIALIGLMGLSYYDLQKRTKEIGIRKANGATRRDILVLVNKEFSKWIFIGLIIACPVSWFAMTHWLKNFAYKTSIDWWIFIIAGSITLFIALLTVSWNTYRAALKNPVDALRYE